MHNVFLAALPVTLIRQRLQTIGSQLIEAGTTQEAIKKIHRMERWLQTNDILLHDIIWFLSFIWEQRIEPTDKTLAIATYQAAFPAQVQNVAFSFAAFQQTSRHLAVVQVSLKLLERVSQPGFLEHLQEPETLDALWSLGNEFTRQIPQRAYQTDFSPEGTESYNASLLAGTDLQKLVTFTRELQI